MSQPITQDTENMSVREKLPIPRIAAINSQPSHRRVPRACELCRERKSKCGGEKPSCRRCLDLAVACIYLDSKHEIDKRLLEQLQAKNTRYEYLLAGVTDEVTSRTADKIHEALESPPRQRRESSSSSSSVGSLDALDVIDEDVNRNEESRATGFIGNNSEIAWMRSLEPEIGKASHEKPEPLMSDSVQPQNTIATKSYYSDTPKVAGPVLLDPYALPPKCIADFFYNAYLDFVHASFPIILERWFTFQYQRWLAVLNMIFAIGSKYRSFTMTDVPSEFDDNIFFSRAKILNANETVLYDHADLQQVQIEALNTFYFLVSAEINRAWKMVRIASGSAIALGINMRSVDVRIHIASKEAHCHLWCSIFMLEHLLTVMTGRSSCLDGSFFAGPPLPVGVDFYKEPLIAPLVRDASIRKKTLNWTLYGNEEQIRGKSEWLKSMAPSQSLYFLYLVDLSLIAHATTSCLYSAQVLEDGWDRLEGQTRLRTNKLDSWLSTVNDNIRFTEDNGDLLPVMLSREQVGLALNYYSTRIVLNRPCLSRPGLRKDSGIRFSRSRFENHTALACIQSALSLLAVLPNEPDTNWLYRTSPWWTMLHFLMQVTTVLLIQISVGSVPTEARVGGEWSGGDTSGSEEVLGSVFLACKKALRWLHNMAMTDVASRRGFELCKNFIDRIALTKDLDLEGIPSLSSLPTTSTGAQLGPNEADVRTYGTSHSSPIDINMMVYENEQLPSSPERPLPESTWGSGADLLASQPGGSQKSPESGHPVEADIESHLTLTEPERDNPD